MEELAEMQEAFAGYFAPANLSAPRHPQRVHWQAPVLARRELERLVPALLVQPVAPVASQPASTR